MANRLWDSRDHTKEKDPSFLMDALGRIVSAYVSNNSMEPPAVSAFIQQIFSTLVHLQHTPHGRSSAQPAVPIAESITPEYLICLEDGKHLKMLKRHIRVSYGLTPEQYRERWNLDVNYPMVAPNYARRRSTLARSNGLGHGRKASSYVASTAAVS